jgi:hypothetical protein
LGTTKLLKAQNLSQSLLSERLFGEHRGHTIRPFAALRRVQQRVFLDLAQLVEKFLGR